MLYVTDSCLPQNIELDIYFLFFELDKNKIKRRE